MYIILRFILFYITIHILEMYRDFFKKWSNIVISIQTQKLSLTVLTIFKMNCLLNALSLNNSELGNICYTTGYLSEKNTNNYLFTINSSYFTYSY